MFIALYPASIVPEENGHGFYVRFADFPEALTSGDDLEDALLPAGNLREPLREIARADFDHRILFDVVSELTPGFDVLDQFGQTFGVESV